MKVRITPGDVSGAELLSPVPWRALLRNDLRQMLRQHADPDAE